MDYMVLFHQFFAFILSFNEKAQIGDLLHATMVAGVSTIWFAHNHIHFQNVSVLLHRSLAFLWLAISKANFLQSGVMNRLISDSLILHKLWIPDKFAKAPKVLPVLWVAPLTGQLKVSTDRTTAEAPGLAASSGIFHTYRGFVKGCFIVHMLSTFAYESELQVVLYAVDFSSKFWWNHLWFKCDNTYLVNLLSTLSLEVPWKFLAHWSNCVQYLSTTFFWVSHISREANYVVDALSEKVLSFQGLSQSFHLLDFCYMLHEEDVFGFETYRFY